MKAGKGVVKRIASTGFLFLTLGVCSAAVANEESKFDSVQIDRDGRVSYPMEKFSLDMLDDVSLSEGFHGLLPDEPARNSAVDSVHGTDERTQVGDTMSYPNRTIGRIALGCTGTLIGPRVVLTAAHCVYDLEKKAWATNLDFSPGQNGKGLPYGTIRWKHATTTKAYTDQGKTEWDIAVIILDEPVGNNVGFMGYSYNDGLTSANININGYPGDKEAGTMWHSYCPLTAINTDLFNYLCDTFKGNSGSAIYQFFSATKERKILGVHTNGLKDTNFGTRITKAKFDKLKAWKAANP